MYTFNQNLATAHKIAIIARIHLSILLTHILFSPVGYMERSISYEAMPPWVLQFDL